MGDEQEGENRYEIQPQYEKRQNFKLINKIKIDLIHIQSKNSPKKSSMNSLLQIPTK